MRINQFGYLLKEGIKGVFSHGFRSFASVAVISACLIIMGAFSMVALNVNAFIGDMEDDSQVLAFVDDALSEEDARSLEGYIRSISNVEDVAFVSRAEAMENYKATFEDQTLFETIDETAFRHRYVVYLNDITLMDSTAEALRAVGGIAEVMAETRIARGFIAVRNVVSIVALVLSLILLVVSLFMMSSTVKLAAFTRRDEIAVMKMVGASNSFIRIPFIVEGLVMGILGAGISFLLEWFIYNMVSSRIALSLGSNLAGKLFTALPFAQVMTPLLIANMVIGILIGAFGGAMAIRNYLKV
ncbi:MAG: permease-like cell division protein FtsX [Oscillospiraceae bacterium]|nr:permease-like cell division protein FtsX [Oscillospiraceae bacterium]MBR6208770.1 permease-like cell division protein FtsX [Oscillospiraceae bacterium]